MWCAVAVHATVPAVRSATRAHERGDTMATTAFLTDATLCIGCKACEVACKEWNQLPEDGLAMSGLSYDNTVELGASTWRHVKFVEHAPTPGLGGHTAAPAWEFS